METKAIVDAVKTEVLSIVTGVKEEIAGRIAALESKGFIDKATAESIVAEAKKSGETRMDALEALLNRNAAPEVKAAEKSVAEQVQDSDEFKELVVMTKGRRPWRARVAVKRIIPAGMEFKTLIDSSAVGSSTPGILVPQRVPGIVPAPRRDLRLRDLLAVRTTENNAVEYIKENAFTNNASPQTEGSAKEESALTFTIASAAVRTIAHWIPATRQVLDDFVELRRYLDDVMMYGLKLKEETEILSGDNLGDHLNGLTTQATAYAGTYNVAGDTQLDKLMHYITELKAANEAANFMVLNPVDLAKVQLLKTEEGGANKGMYLFGDAKGNSVEVPTVWGLPVVESNSIPSGKALVGDARQAAIFDRQEALIELSTEHSDYFTKNKVAIRVEERVTLAVYRPGAFRYGSI